MVRCDWEWVNFCKLLHNWLVFAGVAPVKEVVVLFCFVFFPHKYRVRKSVFSVINDNGNQVEKTEFIHGRGSLRKEAHKTWLWCFMMSTELETANLRTLEARRWQVWAQLRLQAMAITSKKQAKWNKRGKGTEKQTFSSREILLFSISKS